MPKSSNLKYYMFFSKKIKIYLIFLILNKVKKSKPIFFEKYHI